MHQKTSRESVFPFHFLSPGRLNKQLLHRFSKNRSRLFILFLVCEMAAFLIIPASTRIGSTAVWQLVQLGITMTFLIAALLLRRMGDGEYWSIFYTFFVAAQAVLVSLLLGSPVRQIVGYELGNASGIAIAKLSQSILRILPLILMMGLAGSSRESLYLNRGRLGLGLAIGTVGFASFAVLAYAPWIGDLAVRQKLLHLTPWILLFIFANAFEEELLFRGLFLKRYEPFLGKHGANLLTAVAFTLIHIQVTYASNMLQFLAILFPLSLAFGYLMQKSNSLWGSVLFHAGADLMIIVAAFATM